MVTSFVTKDETDKFIQEGYRHVVTDGINVYIGPQAKYTRDTVTFGLEKMLFMSHITIDGIHALPA